MSLLTSLISYWKLDESSGTRFDAFGANNLTDSGSVGSTTGVINSAASFSGSNELDHADNADLSVGGTSFTVAAWFYITETTANRVLAAKGDGFDFAWDILMVSGSPTAPNFRGCTGTGLAGLTGIAGPAVTANAWHFVVAWFDLGLGTLNIQVDDGTPQSTSFAGPYDDTGSFRIASNALNSNFEGSVDEVGFWKRVLTSGERTSLYNGGAGDNSWLGGGGTTVTADWPAPAEWMAGGQADRPFPSEWLSSTARDATAPIEWPAGATRDAGVPGEWLASISRDVTTPTEWMAAASRDAPQPAEWLSSAATDRPLPVEHLAGTLADSPAPSEWGGAVAVTLDSPVPLEWLTTPTRDAGGPSEWVGSVVRNATAPAEWLTGIRADRPLPSEWQGAVTVTADAGCPVEWLGGVLASERLSVEWGGAAVVVYVGPVCGSIYVLPRVSGSITILPRVAGNITISEC